ncbi:flavin reductase like domain-containing protein [Gordonia polyisoprenivorans VH2]|uniref:Flavin reductase like domain-containing protein n=1 Tax=Gordonia polyisoprenivorans (strain DSM 44266 / VH2) TaxID=1112204 RepID=H6MZ70_GORPV|nr:flavin reductase family protein [Gordonia polyisoprenivorans]AFA74406.1 flavin reductase like domain-containing protein [Gordonia polyisoprenivorans VH2]
MTISDLAPAALNPQDPNAFRRVLSHFASGVVAVTSTGPSGEAVGLIATSFTSVSLDPPLVAFYPQKTSTTWPLIRDRGAYCVNILGAAQRDVCAKLAAKGGDKFAEVAWEPDDWGLPAIEGALARISCALDEVHDAGDHEIALGRVRGLHITDDVDPILFFQGGFRRITEPAGEL